MKKTNYHLLLIATIFSIYGCSCRSGIDSRVVTKYADGTVRTEETAVRQPNDAEGGGYIVSTTNGFSVGVAGAQDKAKLAGVVGDTNNKRVLYYAAGLLWVLSLIAWFLPDAIIRPKEAAAGFLVSGAATACVVWVDASADIMKYVIPVTAVSGVVYMVWKFVIKKEKGLNTKLYNPPR